MRTAYTDLDIKITIDDTIFYVLQIVFEHFKRPMPRHSHGNNSYELHYIPHGHGSVNIDDTVYDVTPNTLYMTGPHVEHEQLPAKEDPMSEYCIYFKLQSSPASGKRSRSATASLFEKTHFWYGQDSQSIYPVLTQLFQELEHQYTGYRLQVEALLQQCIVKIVRNYENKKESEAHFQPSNLVDSKYLIIEESFLYDYEILTLDILSKRLGLGNRQTERCLKEYYGKTFLQKKTEARMSMAKIYLSDPSLTISEIANRLNYSSVEHFAYAFKQYYKTSASEYRKRKLK
ncbi:MAG TPA: AraC family transcriptional regulator [Clostridiales bacterium]|nr:AraC family transcriptional regulator [Clostridiales bacterium]